MFYRINLMMGRTKNTPKKIQKRDSDNEWDVEEIVDKRETDGKIEYLVKWKDYSADANTWEPAENLGCHILISNYENQSPEDKKSTSTEAEVEGEEEKNEWEVEKIVGKKLTNRKVFYNVKWKDYPDEENTWEPLSNLASCPDLISQYEDKLKTEKNKNKNNKKDSSVKKSTDKKKIKKSAPIKVKWKMSQTSENDESSDAGSSQSVKSKKNTEKESLQTDIKSEPEKQASLTEVNVNKSFTDCSIEDNKYTSEDIEQVLDKKVVRGKARYFVKWKDDNKADAWILKEALQCDELIAAYEKKIAESKSSNKKK